MCYEERFFSQWAIKKARTSEEPKSVIERPSPQPDRPKPETSKPKKDVEPELEPV
jgi:hypothetical protein